MIREKMIREKNRFNDATCDARIIGNFSGGIASAISCYYALQEFKNIHLAFMNTHLEHPDTFRFINDFEQLTGKKVHIYSSDKFFEPEDVWRKYVGMNFAHGAPCSSVLKKDVRLMIQDVKNDYGQIFGFDHCKKEINRAKNLTINYPEINPIYPLIERKITRNQLFIIAKDLGLKPPMPYEKFLNNNCMGACDSEKGGCVQGGIGYWQKIKIVYPKKYEYMARLEHELTELKRDKLKTNKKYDEDNFEPVTICKDQRDDRKIKVVVKGEVKLRSPRMFLKKYDAMPDIGCIDSIKGRLPVTVFECGITCNTDLFEEFG